MPRTHGYTQEEFINKAKLVHGDKYDYSLVNYKNIGTKVKIICPTHGEFLQEPRNHLFLKSNCPHCAKIKRIKPHQTKEQFLEKANKIHSDKNYQYPDKYINSRTKIRIICPIHGEFFQTPNCHLNGHGCQLCAREENGKHCRGTTEEFIAKANEIHKNKYDYSKVDYVDAFTKIKIICPVHGEFTQRPNSHLSGYGCEKCGILVCMEVNRSNTNNFIERAKLKHNNIYDYSKVIYHNNITKVIIICPKHGEFLQDPMGHLTGHGCPTCRNSRGEEKIKDILKDNGIKYEPQKRFDDCRGKKNPLPFDFYLLDYNILIEYDGKQHFKETHCWEDLKTIQERDAIKTAYCKANNIPLIRIRYDEDIEQRVLELLKSLKVS